MATNCRKTGGINILLQVVLVLVLSACIANARPHPNKTQPTERREKHHWEGEDKVVSVPPLKAVYHTREREAEKQAGELLPATISGTADAAKKISYHGGLVVTGDVPVYVLFHGLWDGPSKGLVRTFLKSLTPPSGDAATPSPTAATPPTVAGWWALTQAYTDAAGRHAGTTIKYAGEAPSMSAGDPLLTAYNLAHLLVGAFDAGSLPMDSSAMYLVLTAPEVRVEGFCTSYCGWHTTFKMESNDVKFAWVGNAGTQCPDTCGPPFPTPHPQGMDGLISITAHELSEMATDAHFDGWYKDKARPTDGLEENADMCEWQFGSNLLKVPGTKKQYNVVGLNGSPFLVQLNLDWMTGKCRLQGDAAAALPSPPSGESPPMASSPPPQQLEPPAMGSSPPFVPPSGARSPPGNVSEGVLGLVDKLPYWWPTETGAAKDARVRVWNIKKEIAWVGLSGNNSLTAVQGLEKKAAKEAGAAGAWVLVPYGKFFYFKNVKTQLCLDIPNGQSKKGLPTQLWRCTQRNVQLWAPSFERKSKGVQWRNVASRLCLTLAKPSSSDKPWVLVQQPCKTKKPALDAQLFLVSRAAPQKSAQII